TTPWQQQHHRTTTNTTVAAAAATVIVITNCCPATSSPKHLHCRRTPHPTNTIAAVSITTAAPSQLPSAIRGNSRHHSSNKDGVCLGWSAARKGGSVLPCHLFTETPPLPPYTTSDQHHRRCLHHHSHPLATAIHHYTAAATPYNTTTAAQPSVATAVTTVATKMVFAWGGRQQGRGFCYCSRS
nr:hypothetical protein [Tanacetum cinerariifolium]